MTSCKLPARLGSVAWLLGLLCAGCSGTPLGDRLTERLSEPDDPVEETAVPSGTAANSSTGEPLVEQPPVSGDPVEDPSPANPTAASTPMGDSPAPGSVSPPPNGPPPNAAQGAALPDSTTTQAPLPLNPAPYRLLLRLPAADPAAPAEAVTRALRTAGILFEVETIERLPNEPTATPMAPSP